MADANLVASTLYPSNSSPRARPELRDDLSLAHSRVRRNRSPNRNCPMETRENYRMARTNRLSPPKRKSSQRPHQPQSLHPRNPRQKSKHILARIAAEVLPLRPLDPQPEPDDRRALAMPTTRHKTRKRRVTLLPVSLESSYESVDRAIYLSCTLTRFVRDPRLGQASKTFGLEVGTSLSRKVVYKRLKMAPCTPMRWPRKTPNSFFELKKKLKMAECWPRGDVPYFYQNPRKNHLDNGLVKITWSRP